MEDEKLLKVMALAASKHDGEALSAVRAAQIMLARQGMTLQDLVRAAAPRAGADAPPVVAPAPPPPPRPPDPEQAQQIATLRRQNQELRHSVEDIGRRLQQQTADADRLRQEAAHWRALARETADRLWDLGKALESQSRPEPTPTRSKAPRSGGPRDAVELLRDPATAILSDREIARRTRLSVPSVRVLRAVLAGSVRPGGAFGARPSPLRPPRRQRPAGHRRSRRHPGGPPHGTSR